ncbi:hypothetical protein C0033_08635 [Clostridium sp. chh4-2]|uniref:SAM-dependent methyltransferase n=1 Tax=Clostridium sp. chh4-2 TaxID=2067550 RepID=UPI000CCE0669|nr:SAM-dependent methyltransferase [Clostridium sp. chh4-2]PNV62614.1 hypothetical protein C0033_08635 [Clostridium sp. chh4-2]
MARLHLEYYKGSGCNQNKIDVNRDIMEYIKKNSDEDYASVLTEDSRWQVFYHLSQMRTSVLNWYEFKKKSDILEIGGEFGALTGMLCDRCQNVTTVEYGLFKAQAIQERYKKRDNLDIYAGNITDMEISRQFDYIIMIGSLERQCGGSKNSEDYVKYLSGLKSYLKPDGKFLIAAENKYGLRYFCGEPENYTKMPFGGIGQYCTPGKGYTFGRHELEMILENAGLIQQRFYYPLPDYKLAQMVYSDEYLPQKDLGERLLFYHPDPSTLLLPEQWLYSDILDNKVFHFFANSFLVECSESGDKGTAVFAAVTTDRGKEHGLATSIHQAPDKKGRRFVKKRALYDDGQKSVRSAYDNIMNLKQHGVPIVPHTMENDAIVMPFVDEITCSDYLRKLVSEKNKEQFEVIFELIYQNIIRSSEIVSSEKNAFPGSEECQIEYGPILKQCYVDMVPFNCFYVDKQLIYFDQEFIKENYPAAYPMFRALMYTYIFTPEAEQLVPLSVMKERYGLEMLWEVLSEEEQHFVADNRRHNVYRNFYQWTWVDLERMEKNRRQIGKCL